MRASKFTELLFGSILLLLRMDSSTLASLLSLDLLVVSLVWCLDSGTGAHCVLNVFEDREGFCYWFCWFIRYLPEVLIFWGLRMIASMSLLGPNLGLKVMMALLTLLLILNVGSALATDSSSKFFWFLHCTVLGTSYLSVWIRWASTWTTEHYYSSCIEFNEWCFVSLVYSSWKRLDAVVLVPPGAKRGITHSNVVIMQKLKLTFWFRMHILPLQTQRITASWHQNLQAWRYFDFNKTKITRFAHVEVHETVNARRIFIVSFAFVLLGMESVLVQFLNCLYGRPNCWDWT